jgi:hypothetical protein
MKRPRVEFVGDELELKAGDPFVKPTQRFFEK